MVSINGVEIDAVTIDGAGVQEITVDGEIVWTKTTTPNTIVDFESGNISAFSGDTGGFVVESGGAYQGDNYLQLNGISGQYIFSYPGDGLNYYPQRGDKFELFYYSNGFQTGEPPFEEVPIFGAEDNSTYYSCFINGHDGKFQLGGGNSNNSTSVTYPDQTWIRILIGFDSNGDGTITATLEDTSTNSQIAQVSINDESINGRGVGIEADIWGNYDKDRRVDNWKIVK